MQKYTKALEKLIHSNCEVRIFQNKNKEFTVITRGYITGIGEHKQWRRAIVLAEKDYFTQLELVKENEELLYWNCKYCGENEEPHCHKCVREDGKLVSDELAD